MKTMLLLLMAGAATPALAQHAGHAEPSPPAASSCTPEHAAMGHCTMPPPAEQTADPHAGHQMPPEQPSAADPHAGHAAHPMPAGQAEVPVGPPLPEALSGPEHAADRVWGSSAMQPGRAVLFGEHGGGTASKILFDQVEARVRKGRDAYFINAEGWYGGDIDKLWLKAEIEGRFGDKPEQAEFQALWSHAIDPWFDLQAGLRFDARPDHRAHLVLGVQGLAPYWIEVDGAAFLSDRGDLTARAEAEHDVRITRKLILQPRLEVDFALQDIEREHIGSGLSTADLGLRLRYEIRPTFAPYMGVSYERAFGDTRRFMRAEGEDAGSLNFAIGVRSWF